MKRFLAMATILAILLVSLSLIAGCGGQPPAPSTSAPSQPAAPTPAASPPPSPAAAQQIKMRCAGEFAPPEAISVVLTELQTTIPQVTNNRVKFEYYPAAQLYNHPDGITALKAGGLEMGFNGMPLAFLSTEWDLLCGIPFLINDSAHLKRFEESNAYKNFSQRLEAQGIKPLTKVYAMGDQPIFNNKRAVAKLEDLKGIKFSSGPAPTLMESLTLLSGSKPINVPVSEMATSLETGVFDGSMFPWPVQVFLPLPKILPYVTNVNYAVSFPIGLVVSAKWWNSLPSDLQPVLQKTFEDAMTKYDGMITKVSAEQFDIFKKTPGTTVTELTPAEKDRWTETLKPLYDKVGKDPNLAELVQAAQATK
jgi:TRAP-type C4-dicarboxylate transport system substrate-binding protein